MRIGYNKLIASVWLLFSLFSCCLAVVFVRTDESTPPVDVAVFWLGLLIGILMLTRPYMEITQNYVVVKSPFGFVTRRYGFASAKDFSIESGKIYVLHDGLRQKLAVSSWMADKRGWISFIKWIKDEGLSPAVSSEVVA